MQQRVLALLLLIVLLTAGCGGPKSPFIEIPADSDIGVVADTVDQGGKAPRSAKDLDSGLKAELAERASTYLSAWVTCDYRMDVSQIKTQAIPYLTASRKAEYLYEAGLFMAQDRVLRNRLVIKVNSVDVQSIVVREDFAFVQGEVKVTLAEAAWVDPNGRQPGDHTFRFRVALSRTGSEWLVEYHTEGEWK